MAISSNKMIVIKKEYFDNIKTAIGSLNDFFSSNFKKKDFPDIDSEFQIDGTIMNILSWLNLVDPTWINDPDKIEDIINALNDPNNEKLKSNNPEVSIYQSLVDSNDTELLDHINAFIGFKILKYISDHFNEFTEFINGIYTFDLFMKTSLFKNVTELFSQPIPLDEISTIMGDTQFTLFDSTKYVTGIFDNTTQIILPDELKLDTEISRVDNNIDINSDIEIVVDSDESVQEAAEINYFKELKPEHIKYDPKTNSFTISNQFKKTITELLTEIRKCENVKDLGNFFKSDAAKSYSTILPDTVSPYILNKVFDNTEKFSFDEVSEKLKDYTKSYDSIIEGNNGAKRFQNYDIFSTFKIDKEGTIKFIEDFLTLKLFNDENAIITNNKILSIFNIFDSRIYFDILYNLIPKEVKDEMYPSEDSFVKSIRGRINKLSHANNVYQKDEDSEDEPTTSSEVMEYVSDKLKEYGYMSTAEMNFCEHYQSILLSEISCLGDRMYNSNTSPIMIDHYIGESYSAIPNGFVQEVETGDIPDYIKTRMNISDGNGSPPKVNITNVDVPSNSVDELATSINARIDSGGDLSDALGTGYNENPNKNNEEGKVVYNITNNYTNSFNKSSNSTSSNVSNNNDLSSNKKTETHVSNNNSNNDSSTNKTAMTNSSTHENANIPETDKNTIDKDVNHYNNSSDSLDTKDSIRARDDEQKLSSGKSIQEMFTFLESEEPLSSGNDAGKPPKGDLLTSAMDRDRKTLAAQQGAKKKAHHIVGTGKAIFKPLDRTKKWLTGIVDSLIKRDEDKVKAEIIESPSYRTALYKAGRLALKFGLTGICFTINGYLGAAYVAIEGAKLADKQRLKNEVQDEFGAELEILNDKIEKADQLNTPDSNKSKWEMMRLRSKMQSIMLDSSKSKIKHPRSIA